MKKLLAKMDFAIIRPSPNARRTLDTCFRNRMAWKLAGRKFRDQLVGTFEIELDDKVTQVIIDEENWKHFKNIVIQHDLD